VTFAVEETQRHTPTTLGERRNTRPGRALVIEDVRAADIALQECGLTTDRITHNELISSAGDEYTGKIMHGNYDLLWITTPSDWFVRAANAKTGAHWKRVHNLICKSMLLGMLFVLFGPPGYMWKVPNLIDTFKENQVTITRMRLCHFNDKYDKKSSVPSGSYLQVATISMVPAIRRPLSTGVLTKPPLA